jgi:DivIVA domain-containing protein
MMSIFARPADPARFRLRWLGYDRGEVDEFLRQTEADRQRLQEDLAQLEAVMSSHGEERRRELERLSVLRIEVASCLETSIGALRAATERLSSTPASAAAPKLAPEAPARFSLPSISGGRTRMLVVAGSAATLILVTFLGYQYHPRANERPTAATAGDAGHQTSKPAPSPAPSDSPTPMIQQVEGLVLALTARSTCWIGTSIDGGQRLERILKPDETIMLRAEQEAVLRVGDAAALSVLINNRLARPLGAGGQVVTARITRANYLSFLKEK